MNKAGLKNIEVLMEALNSGKILFLTMLSLFAVSNVFAQNDVEKEKEKALIESLNYTYEGNEVLKDNNDAVEAEMAYRKAISKSDSNSKAKYNLGNVYYNSNSMGEAFMRYKEAGITAMDKADKHKAYHNLGNVFMKNKEYAKAVEAYKDALRNDPTDEETRYNLALAKEMLKKQQDQNQNNQDNKDDKDQNQDQNKDNKNQDKENKDQQDKKDDQDGEDKKDEQGDQKDQKNEGDNKDEQGENPEDDKQDKGKQDKDEQQDPQQQQQPRPNQLSPQQIKNILEAMNNEEKKVQEKINAEKIKGKPVRTEKDW